MKKTIRIMEKKEKLTIFGVKPFAIAKRIYVRSLLTIPENNLIPSKNENKVLLFFSCNKRNRIGNNSWCEKIYC